ncbi:disease resistance protein At4g27190-like [Benincasa hispida]|uniref:disease resistance protein At4g27190-like n=1 Tax=Benincasa hispida TaxID=102211 RepID=UPI0018FF6603|nr:disease resistance protein At4g27190-like [Benincasa hispida]XP_038901765.1 disease resistance protein At4g27190-like [Benincasa hispida]XP_038901766.1 disease resistance protein At4g27190-like [Benincasa hispida]
MAFLMDVAVGIVTEVGKCVFKPIGHQLGYIIFYNRNKEELKEQLENLETTKRDVHRRVEEARSNSYAIHEQVSKWLVDVDNALVHDELSNSNPSCINLLQRHQLSRKTKKRTIHVLELINKRNNFVEVGCPAPLPDTENTIIPDGYQVLGSKTSMAKQIKDALARPEVKKVGIYGMGGVGKTYLLNEVKKLVLEDKLFDRVIDVSVGQSNDVMQMQQQIGDILNKELPKSKEGRASFLRNILVEMKCNILITLDDLWKEYNLIKEIGIPCSDSSKEGCKVLMTSRFQNVLTNYMNTNKCFEVTSLDEEESWMFFTKIIGNKFDTIDMKNVAKEVARECGGLPLALDIIAKTLKGKHINCWEDALSKLKNPIAMDIKDVSDKVYASLRLSYDFLDGDEAKLLFLLCSVFPDDYEIPVKDLQMYAMSMRLLKMVNTWKKARNRVVNLVQDLASSSLLQLQEVKYPRDGEDVKMHDIVRDAAINIASTTNDMCTLNYGYTNDEGLDEDKCGSYRAIYIESNNSCNLPPNVKFPKLELLILRCYTQLSNVDASFDGMENLKVLDLRDMHFPSCLWTSLKQLRALCLSSCECIDIDKIGHLKELEILKIIRCNNITELPVAMSELKQLKVLVVSECYNLVVIRPNIISSMTKLEELDIRDCFNEWGEELWYENTWIQNAQLSELNSLLHLSILRLHISKAKNILSKDLSSQTLKKLREFFIFVGTTGFTYDVIELLRRNSCKCEKSLSFNMESQIGSVDWTVFDILLKGTELLTIAYNDSTDFDPNVIFKANGNGYPLLKWLAIEGNPTMSHLIINDFSSLEWLGLSRMMMLESIVPRHVPANPFNKLKVIKIGSCEQLRNLFSLDIFKGVSELQEIEIHKCDMMDEIVSSVEIEDHTTSWTSPLTSLRLWGVEKLTSFCTKPFIPQNPETIIPFFDRKVSFPQLKFLSIESGNNLEILWHNNGPIGSSFSKLQTIKIVNCNKLKCVFPSNIVTSLVCLDDLEIHSCVLLEKVFEIEKPTFGDTKVVVPLRNLTLRFLPNLKYVGNKDVGDLLVIPNLKEVRVNDCPKLKSLFPASFNKYMKEADEQNEIFSVDEASNLREVSFPQLEDLFIERCNNLEMLWYNNGPIGSSLSKLQTMKIKDCNKLKCMFSSNIVASLVFLDDLYICSCQLLERVFEIEKPTFGDTKVPVPLRSLYLSRLPNLMYVWNKDAGDVLSFPNLKNVDVTSCPKLKSMFPASFTKYMKEIKHLNVEEENEIFPVDEASNLGEVVQFQSLKN